MKDSTNTAAHRIGKLWLLPAVLLSCAGVSYGVMVSEPPQVASVRPESPEATHEAVQKMCAACHAYPPPDTFPRSAWRKEVKQGFDFFLQDPSLRFEYPSLESVVRYYEARAPLELASIPSAHNEPAPVQFDREEVRGPVSGAPPGAAHVNLVHLFSKDHLDILVCDAINKQVLVLSPYESKPAWKVLAEGVCCAHAEVVDLDGDGVNDLILACLGSFYATDDRVGSVIWLKGTADGKFTPVTLLDGIGRVADVRVANFMGTKKLDLIVAEFGWHQTGGILLLENQTTDWAHPAFKTRILDERHGATHVPVVDLNHDGKPDFVAVISQEFETVVAFLNEGNGHFRKEIIYKAPHPAFGCNGVQIVDLDGDGNPDVLLTNGDSLDAPYLLRPDHGLTWLQNRGTYPFIPHRLADCCGAGSPVTADFDGNGLLDVAFVTFLPREFFPKREAQQLSSVVLLSQTAPGKFTRHSLESGTCDHLTCAAGSLNGNGQPDLVVGNYVRGSQVGNPITIWHNTTQKKSSAAR